MLSLAWPLPSLARLVVGLALALHHFRRSLLLRLDACGRRLPRSRSGPPVSASATAWRGTASTPRSTGTDGGRNANGCNRWVRERWVVAKARLMRCPSWRACSPLVSCSRNGAARLSRGSDRPNREPTRRSPGRKCSSTCPSRSTAWTNASASWSTSTIARTSRSARRAGQQSAGRRDSRTTHHSSTVLVGGSLFVWQDRRAVRAGA